MYNNYNMTCVPVQRVLSYHTSLLWRSIHTHLSTACDNWTVFSHSSQSYRLAQLCYPKLLSYNYTLWAVKLNKGHFYVLSSRYKRNNWSKWSCNEMNSTQYHTHTTCTVNSLDSEHKLRMILAACPTCDICPTIPQSVAPWVLVVALATLPVVQWACPVVLCDNHNTRLTNALQNQAETKQEIQKLVKGGSS